MSPTAQCLTGCAIGTPRRLDNWTTVVLSVVLAFVFGSSLTMVPLLRARLGLKTATAPALASDTASIALMELVENFIMVFRPGADRRRGPEHCLGHRGSMKRTLRACESGPRPPSSCRVGRRFESASPISIRA
jgi:hypothetical protein